MAAMRMSFLDVLEAVTELAMMAVDLEAHPWQTRLLHSTSDRVLICTTRKAGTTSTVAAIGRHYGASPSALSPRPSGPGGKRRRRPAVGRFQGLRHSQGTASPTLCFLASWRVVLSVGRAA